MSLRTTLVDLRGILLGDISQTKTNSMRSLIHVGTEAKTSKQKTTSYVQRTERQLQEVEAAGGRNN